jgi:uncharacterized membrane protein
MSVVTVIRFLFFVWSMFARFPVTSTGSNPTIPNFSSIFFGVGAIPLLIGITTLIGIILFIVAMRRLSQYYNEQGIFKNTLFGFILNIVGSITATAISAIESASMLRAIGTNPPVTSILTPLVLDFLGLGIVLVFGIMSAVLYMRAFDKLAEESGRDNFKTAGSLYLISVVLSIVLIGGLLMWIAWIFAAMGFNSLKPKEPSTPTLAYPTSQTPKPTI